MNGCSHDKNTYSYRGLLACKKCGIVFGPQFKIEGKISTNETLDSKRLIDQKSEITEPKKFSVSIKFQTS